MEFRVKPLFGENAVKTVVEQLPSNLYPINCISNLYPIVYPAITRTAGLDTEQQHLISLKSLLY